jgi:putative ABC transport system ATP-binding protein
MPSSAMLRLRQVTKSFGTAGTRAVLRGVDLEVAPGEYVAIMGESGIGKSTLLNVIAGLERPDFGSVQFEGRELAGLTDDELTGLRRSSMGFVFQAFHVLPYLSVAQNVELPLALARIETEVAAKRVGEMLQAVGLEERAHSMPRELSGGELQRVAIARALVHRPKLVLADEPTGNLDPDTAHQVLEQLRFHIKQHAAAGILVTHSTDAAATADRAYLLTAEGLRLRS